MKRIILPLLLAVVAAVSISCIREEDKDIFNHPIHIQGSIDPYFGVPIGYGEMNLSDLLASLDDTYSGYVEPDEEILTIVYERVVDDTMHLSHMFGGDKHHPKRGRHIPKNPVHENDTAVWADTTLLFDLDIDLFNKVSASELAEFDLSIAHLWVSMLTQIGADSPDADRQDIRDNASLVFDNFNLDYIDYAGVTHTYGEVDMPPISLLDMLGGGEVGFENIDIASVVNDLPTNITASFRMTLFVNKQYFDGLPSLEVHCFKDLADSMHLTWMTFSADMKAVFPMMIHIGGLPFHYTIDFGDELEQVDLDSILHKINEGIEVGLESSSLNLVVDNGLPLSLAIQGTLIDENGEELCNIIPLDTLKAAPTAPLAPGSPDHEAIGSTRGKIMAVLDYDKLKMLNEAKGMRFDLGIATNDGHAAIKRDDFLRLKAHLKVHPTISIDIPLTGGDNEDNDKK